MITVNRTLTTACILAAAALLTPVVYFGLLAPGAPLRSAPATPAPEAPPAPMLAWTGPDGTPLRTTAEDPTSPWMGCSGVELGLDSLVAGERAYVACAGHERFPHGALAVVEPTEGRGRVLWPYPEHAPHGGQTFGALPGPGDTLAIVYVRERISGPLAAGVAGPGGWAVEPFALLGTVRPTLLAMAWNGATAEAVFTHEGTVHVHPIAPGAAAREVPREALCADEAVCDVQAAYLVPGEGWHYLVYRGGEGAGLWRVAPGKHATREALPDAAALRDEADRAALGVLTAPRKLRWTITAGGEIEPFAPVPDGVPEWVGFTHAFVYAPETGLRARRSWSFDDTWVHELDDHTLSARLDGPALLVRPGVTTATTGTNDTDARPWHRAHADHGARCSHIVRPAIVETAATTYFVDGAGCYVGIARALLAD